MLRTADRDIPLVVVSCNHDVGNVPTPETIAEFQRTWGDDYFSFWVGGCPGSSFSTPVPA